MDEYESSIDHFKKTDDSNNHYFSTSPLSNEHTFCKLHGSLDWTKEVDTHRIIRKKQLGFERVETKGRIMLFPIQQKDLYLHPWFTLFQDLKLGLSQKTTLYVIGYAFNDEFIRNAFEESLADNSDKKLVIINPDVKQIKDKFSKSIQNQIDVLPIKFGDEFFELQFEDHVKKVKTIVLRFITKNNLQDVEGNQITIQSNHNIQSGMILNNNEEEIMCFSEGQGTGTVNEEDKKHMFFRIQNPRDMEIKLELKIDYVYDDEIELYISDGTEKLNVGIDYGGRMIVSSNDIKKEYVTKDEIVWIKHPIKLDKAKLYL